ncbi:hypothetical protein NC651_014569 [Populus alba x Populus x berolinensis]|nr:hypothetical protein NC651_014568 [Populus alba x Populus x berolinensis]KAJ6921025.1 hypothetical protein NC651_014569 [Populus alba x Populus x berolinensis]
MLASGLLDCSLAGLHELFGPSKVLRTCLFNESKGPN